MFVSSVSLLPYGALAAVIVASVLVPKRAGLVGLTLATVIAIAMGRVDLLGAGWLALAAISLHLATAAGRTWVRWFAGLTFLGVGAGLFEHLLPGIHNLRVFDKIRFSPDAAPFTMYLNFDRTAVGLLIYIFYLDRRRPITWRVVARTYGALVALVLPIALLTAYVRVEPKVPELAWLWALNNLFFVCLAEEGVFRGLIQGYLTAKLRFKWIALVIAAGLFGLDHYRGGVTYIAFATLAGLFYGYAFLKARRIEASMLVHFGLNLTHFILFTYPNVG